MKRNLLTILLCAVLAIIGTTSCEKENWREPDYGENVEGEENGDQTGDENEGEQGGENEGEGGENEGEGGENEGEGGENEGEGGENEGGENEGEGGNEEVVVKNLELTTFGSFTDYLAMSGGANSLVGLELATDGISFTEMDYGGYKYMQVGGNGDVLKIEFYSADGTLAAGTYTACATEGTPGPGEFNYGYDFTQQWGDQSFTSVYGSCVTTYQNDQAISQTKITDGTVTVEVNGDVYTITLTSSTVNATYVGEIPQGTTPDEGGENEGEGGNEEVVVKNLELTTFGSFTDYLAMSGGANSLVGLELATDGITFTEMDYGGYKYMQVGGNGDVLKIEFYSADGTLAAGTYTACATEGTPGPGEFNYGYDFTQQWGDQSFTSVYGSCVTTYQNDQAISQTKVTDGTATVEVNGDVYTITLTSSTVNAIYVGEIPQGTTPDEGEPEVTDPWETAAVAVVDPSASYSRVKELKAYADADELHVRLNASFTAPFEGDFLDIYLTDGEGDTFVWDGYWSTKGTDVYSKEHRGEIDPATGEITKMRFMLPDDTRVYIEDYKTEVSGEDIYWYIDFPREYIEPYVSSDNKVYVSFMLWKGWDAYGVIPTKDGEMLEVTLP